MPISTLHNSRFLSSGAMDFAKMLTVLGVDRVVAIDLQRPGQGGEKSTHYLPLRLFQH